MMLFLRMAWRNIGRNPRRTAITVAAISLGLAVLIVAKGLGDGVHEQMVENSIRIFTGHLQVHARDYQEDPGLNRAIKHPEEVYSVLARQEGVVGFSGRVLANGLASSAENSAGVRMVGIDPAREAGVTTVTQNLIRGQPLGMQERGILIGAKLADLLHVDLDEKVVLMAQAADGSLAADLFRVTGIFRTGSPVIDEAMVYVGIAQAQEMLVLGERISEIALLLEDSGRLPAVADALKAELSARELEIQTWEELSPDLVAFIKLDDASLYIFIVIVFSIVALGILNTLLMAILERVREFGIMMALGTQPRQIVGLIMLEAAGLGLISLFMGGTLGVSVTWYLSLHGIDLTRWVGEMPMMGTVINPILYTSLHLDNLVDSLLMVIVITLLSAIYPAIRAARLRPVAAIRHL